MKPGTWYDNMARIRRRAARPLQLVVKTLWGLLDSRVTQGGTRVDHATTRNMKRAGV